jgi:hypothetical protein
MHDSNPTAWSQGMRVSPEKVIDRLIEAREAIHGQDATDRSGAAKDLLRCYEILGWVTRNDRRIRHEVLTAFSYDAPVLSARLPDELQRIRQCLSHETLDLAEDEGQFVETLYTPEWEGETRKTRRRSARVGPTLTLSLLPPDEEHAVATANGSGERTEYLPFASSQSRLMAAEFGLLPLPLLERQSPALPSEEELAGVSFARGRS